MTDIPFDQNIDLNGNNLVNPGTVDGRDIATDGSKLDGIESGATGDMTGAEIKTAYEGESDTNAFTDAEKTKLAGIATGAVADHGALSGLSDDDHIQYVSVAPSTTLRNAVSAGSSGVTPLTLGGHSASSVDLLSIYLGVSKKVAVDLNGTLQLAVGAVVTGNISVTGTVDGRDVAADGTKLDGIDSGAKAPGYGTLSELPSNPVDGELFFATDAAGGGGELVVYDGDNSQWRSAALHMHRLAYNVAASASTHQLLFGNLSTTDAACPIFLDDDITISHVRLGHLATEARARTLNIYANGSGTPSFTSSSFNLNTGSWGSQQFTVDTDFSAGDRLNVAVSGGAASTNTKFDCRIFFYYRY